MQTIFNTPADAELAFYAALERGDLAAMKQVWSEDDSIICIHPGSGRLEGRADVIASFKQLFHDAPSMNFLIADAHCSAVGDIAIHLVREEIEIDGQLITIMLSTNIYQQINGSWRMTLHHASPEPDVDFDAEFDAGFDEADFTPEMETPIVLH